MAVLHADAGQMTLVDHLGELRARIIKSVVAIAAGAVAGWFLYFEIVEVLLEPYCNATNNDCGLLILDPLEGLSTRMLVAAYTGIALAVPVWLWQAWRFVSPGLHPHERRYGVAFVVLGVGLFSSGAGLAFWTLPRALEFLIDIGGEDLITQFQARPYIDFVVKMMLAFGLGFEFPLVLAFAQIVGLITPQQLGTHRRTAAVGIVVLVAVITPSGDPVSLLALAGPMYLFYEAAITFGRLRQRSKRRALT